MDLHAPDTCCRPRLPGQPAAEGRMRPSCPTRLYMARCAALGLASTATFACWGSGADLLRALRYPRHIRLLAGCSRRPIHLKNVMVHERRMELIDEIANGPVDLELNDEIANGPVDLGHRRAA